MKHKTQTLHSMTAVCFIAAAFSAPMSMASEPVLPPGEAVTQWLDLQRSGKAASPHAQPLNGAMMTRAYERHLKTFEQPIPAMIGEQGGSSTSGGKK